jgi:hypothetical protein
MAVRTASSAALRPAPPAFSDRAATLARRLYLGGGLRQEHLGEPPFPRGARPGAPPLVVPAWPRDEAAVPASGITGATANTSRHRRRGIRQGGSYGLSDRGRCSVGGGPFGLYSVAC